MKYQITLNDDDYLQFNIFYAHHSKVGKRSVRTTQLLFAIFSIILIALMFLIFGTTSELVLPVIVVYTILSVICYFRMPKSMEKNVLKNMEHIRSDGKLPYHVRSEIEFQDSMIVERYEQGEFRLKYEDIEHIYPENDYLYIFHTALSAFVIPYRCLGADKERVIQYLMEKRADLSHNVG